MKHLSFIRHSLLFVIRHSRRGFTLIELLVVVMIISLLVAVVAISGGLARAKARDTRRKEDLRQLQTAVETHFQIKGKYPFMASTWRTDSDLKNQLLGQFLSTMPTDPRSDSGTASWPPYYVYQATDGTENQSDPINANVTRYRLISALEITDDIDQPTTQCSKLIATGQNPSYCATGQIDFTLLQTGGSLWGTLNDPNAWGEKSF